MFRDNITIHSLPNTLNSKQSETGSYWESHDNVHYSRAHRRQWRKFGSLSIQEILVVTWPSAHPFLCTMKNKISHFLASVGACNQILHIHVVANWQLKVKTGYPLTSITWPYSWLRCRPIEVACFLKVNCWQVTSFYPITGLTPIGYFLCNMFTSLLFKVNYKFTNRSFASSLRLNLYIMFLLTLHISFKTSTSLSASLSARSSGSAPTFWSGCSSLSCISNTLIACATASGVIWVGEGNGSSPCAE